MLVWSSSQFLSDIRRATVAEATALFALRSVSFGGLRRVKLLRVEASNYSQAGWDYGIFINREIDLTNTNNVFTIASGVNVPYERNQVENLPFEFYAYGLTFYHGRPITVGDDLRLYVLVEWWKD